MTRMTLIAFALSLTATAPALAGEDIDRVDFGPELPEVLDAARLHQAVEILTHPVALRPRFPGVELTMTPEPFDTCARIPRPREVERVDEHTLVYRIELHDCPISDSERVSGSLIFHPSFLDKEELSSRDFGRAARSWARNSTEAWFSLSVVTDSGAEIQAEGQRWGDLGSYEDQVDMLATRAGSEHSVDVSYEGQGVRLPAFDALRTDGELLVYVEESVIVVAAERLGRLDGDATPCLGAYVYGSDGEAAGDVEVAWTFRSRRDGRAAVRSDGGNRRMSLPHL